jgi:hypothetical protein
LARGTQRHPLRLACSLIGQAQRQSVDLQGLVAQDQAVARTQFTPANSFSIDDGSVGRLQVLQNPGSVPENQASVMA